jgi:hypothetical protein
LTSVARHHELGPVGLVVLRRSTPPGDLLVDCDGGAVAAGQEEIVPGDGVSADRPDARGPVTRGLGGGTHGAAGAVGMGGPLGTSA